MRRFTLFAVSLFTLVPALPVSAGDAKQLDGSWLLTSLVIDGAPRSFPEGMKLMMILKDGNFTFHAGERLIGQGVIATNDAALPKHFDMMEPAENQKQDTQRGIYELSDDLLKVCLAPAGKDRPAEFHSRSGSGFELQTYKRLKWETDRTRFTHWVAFVQGPPSTLRFILNLERDGANIVGGTLDIPDLRNKGLPLGTVRTEGLKLSIVSPSKTQGFEGAIADDGRAITGVFKAGGQATPLHFLRVDTLPDFFSRPQEPKDSLPYEAEDVVFENKAAGLKLAGTLTRPRSSKPSAAVVLASMSGGQDRNATEFGHKPFLVLADHLTRQGFAVLRFDDRGIGASTGKFLGATSADFADDVRAGLDFLKSRKEIDPAKIGIVGHSEGGVIAPLVAAKSRDVAFIVLLAGPSLPGSDTALIQTEHIFRTFGSSAKQIGFNLKLQKRFIGTLQAESNDEAAAAKIRAAIQQEFAELDANEQNELRHVKESFEQQMLAETFPWHRYFVQHDPRTVLAQVQCPVLALFGSKDVQVPARDHLPEMVKALSGNADATVKEMPRCNHLLQRCTYGSMHEYCAITETMSPEVLELVSVWIRQRTK